MINITESAAIKIASIISEENNSKAKLRVYVQGGGCSGFSYGFDLDEENPDDDFLIENSGIAVIIDAMSIQYLQNATIDYKNDLTGSQFVVTNPDAQSTCGCGSSFSI